jgi:hypothetical protein
MKKMTSFLGFFLFFVSGCAAMGNYPHASVTQVNLEKNNFAMVKPDAAGASSGFVLFGLIPITSPQHTVAMSRLYDNAGIRSGGAYALANVVQEVTNSYFILFSIPTYRIRADVVEFKDESNKAE